MLLFFVYALIGKLLLFLIQKSPYPSLISWRFLEELLSCSLCSGVWVYFILAWIFGINLFSEIINGYEILMYFLTGSATSFLVWIFSTGWNELFGVVEIK